MGGRHDGLIADIPVLLSLDPGRTTQIKMPLDEAVDIQLKELQAESGKLSFHGYNYGVRLYPKGKGTKAWLAISCANQYERYILLGKILQASKDWQLFDKEERKKILKQGYLDLEQGPGVDLSVPKPAAPTREQMRRRRSLRRMRRRRVLRKQEAQEEAQRQRAKDQHRGMRGLKIP